MRRKTSVRRFFFGCGYGTPAVKVLFRPFTTDASAKRVLFHYSGLGAGGGVAEEGLWRAGKKKKSFSWGAREGDGLREGKELLVPKKTPFRKKRMEKKKKSS